MAFRDGKSSCLCTPPGGGTGGITSSEHRTLDQLVHAVAENSFDELVYTGSRVDSLITWTNAGKTVKIREEIYTYTGSKVTAVVTRHYDALGVVITGETMTENLTYTGSRVDSISRALT